jgi:hypothetical protein
MDSRATFTKKEAPLMLRRIFRVAILSALARAWGQKSRSWLMVGVALVFLRSFDRHNVKSHARIKARAASHSKARSRS